MHTKTRIATVLAIGLALHASTIQAAQLVGSGRSDILIGRDDDNQSDLEIQPEGVAANQSLNNEDTLIGGRGDDILIGMLGSDVLLGGPGDDVMIGGIERGTQPNSDVQIGDSGNDIALWQGGDGSDAFDGGPGPRDTLVFGTIDRDPDTNVPIISPVNGRHAETGLPDRERHGAGRVLHHRGGARPSRARFRVPGALLLEGQRQPAGHGAHARRRAGLLHRAERRRRDLRGPHAAQPRARRDFSRRCAGPQLRRCTHDSLSLSPRVRRPAGRVSKEARPARIHTQHAAPFDARTRERRPASAQS